MFNLVPSSTFSTMSISGVVLRISTSTSRPSKISLLFIHALPVSSMWSTATQNSKIFTEIHGLKRDWLGNKPMVMVSKQVCMEGHPQERRTRLTITGLKHQNLSFPRNHNLRYQIATRAFSTKPSARSQPILAEQLLTQAREGDKAAQFALGKLHIELEANVKPRPEYGLQLLKAAADNGHIPADEYLNEIRAINPSYKVNDEQLKGLVHIPNLITLDLKWCTQITYKGLLGVGKLSQLRKLEIIGCNKITDQGSAKLQLRLPELHIS